MVFRVFIGLQHLLRDHRLLDSRDDVRTATTTTTTTTSTTTTTTTTTKYLNNNNPKPRPIRALTRTLSQSDAILEYKR